MILPAEVDDNWKSMTDDQIRDAYTAIGIDVAYANFVIDVLRDRLPDNFPYPIR